MCLNGPHDKLCVCARFFFSWVGVGDGVGFVRCDEGASSYGRLHLVLGLDFILSLLSRIIIYSSQMYKNKILKELKLTYYSLS